MVLDDEIDAFLDSVKYAPIEGQSDLAGSNKDAAEQPVADDEFYHGVKRVRQAAEIEASRAGENDGRFYIVLGVTAVLLVVCFVLMLEFGSSTSAASKTGVFAAITGIFGLYLDHERKRAAGEKARSAEARLLKESVNVIRDPGDLVRVISAAKQARSKVSKRRGHSH